MKSSDDAQQFIRKITSSDFGITGLHAVLCEFDENQLDDSDFERLSVYQPDNIKRAVRKRRADYLAGRCCAASALQAFGRSDSYDVLSGPSREPLWPDGVAGSITHSGQLAAAIVGSNTKFSGLGIDIERVVKHSVAKQLSQRVLTPTEAEWVNQSHTESELLFTSIFGIKEAFFKAAFPCVGRYFGFSAISVDSFTLEQCGRGEQARFRVNQDLATGLKKGQMLDAQVERLPNDQIRALVVIQNG